MDANQDSLENPFSMDEACTNCPTLCETRANIAHGYGDVGGEFLFVGESPGPGADEAGIPFVGDSAGERLQYVLGELGFSRSPPDATEPDLQNVFLTYLTRCRHPERPPTDDEIGTCEPYLNAEIRMINPEIIVPVGQRPLEALAVEYTTRRPDSFDVDEEHATTIRGRGFELIPMVELDRQTDDRTEAFVEHVKTSVFGRDYRQTKGRRGR
ncbi:uracil-DNA glycosylase [Halegenticoccus tardaugens]|uniref:uracil-DNA glycosylase n=1 Tax=Halegenticoccus tardaugens TaxID=2071624 RepID=UPI00100AF9FA|nr:uracil-DNA glycosylase [Halegenticoccus tardaugens]